MKTIKFFHETGWWMPAHEKHMVEWMVRRNEPVDGRLTYQFHKLVAAVEVAKGRRRAVDVGGHVGLWSAHLAKRFAQVDAFEPVQTHRECFVRNVIHPNVRLHAAALGNEHGTVLLKVPDGSSGGTHVSDQGEEAPLHVLDEYAFDDVDFLKIDCEGYELHVLEGARETLERCKPAIIVEQKPGRAEKYALGRTDAIPFLKSLGAVLHREIGGDFIMGWPQ